MRILPAALFALASASITLSGTACAKDITQLVKSKTDIDRQLDSQCEHLAAGNEKKCWLKSVDFDLRLQQPTSLLTAVFALQSKHVPSAGIVFYDDTAYVELHADVDNNDCHISNVRIESRNDIYKILISLVGDRINSEVKKIGSVCDF